MKLEDNLETKVPDSVYKITCDQMEEDCMLIYSIYLTKNTGSCPYLLLLYTLDTTNFVAVKLSLCVSLHVS